MRIGLSTAVEAVRRELLDAIAAGEDESVRFPVGEISLTFQVGITKSTTGKGGVQLWVLELGAEGGYSKETVQTVTVTLGPPVDADGNPVKVSDRRAELPG